MNIGIAGYTNLCYKYKILILIWGFLTYKLLKCLKLKLRAYDSSIEIDLEDRYHRYLEIVLIDSEYALINKI